MAVVQEPRKLDCLCVLCVVWQLYINTPYYCMCTYVRMYVYGLQRSELGEDELSVVGGVVARALEQDFATGFRPEDTSLHSSPWSAPLIIIAY